MGRRGEGGECGGEGGRRVGGGKGNMSMNWDKHELFIFSPDMMRENH